MIEIRPTSDEAAERVSLEIYNEVWPRDAMTAAESDAFFSSLVDHAHVVAYLRGEPVGSAVWGVLATKQDLVYALVAVLPDARRNGVASHVYARVCEWACERGLATLETRVNEDDPESLAFVERRGFHEYARNGRLILDLRSATAPPADPPAGIEITTLSARPELARGMYEVAQEAFPDIPGQEDWVAPPFEHYLAHHIRGPTYPPEATFVALAAGEVVAYAKFRISEARPGVAIHHMTAVKRAWRGRGVAGALKRTQLAWAKEHGFAELETDNETRNEPIRRLNERLGYRPAPGHIYLRRPVPTSDES